MKDIGTTACITPRVNYWSGGVSIVPGTMSPDANWGLGSSAEDWVAVTHLDLWQTGGSCLSPPFPKSSPLTMAVTAAPGWVMFQGLEAKSKLSPATENTTHAISCYRPAVLQGRLFSPSWPSLLLLLAAGQQIAGPQSDGKQQQHLLQVN